jgi:hypothetical protein
MGEALVQGVTRRVDDVLWRIEIGFTNFEMNNVASLCFQRSCFHEYFEGGLGAETRHALGETKFALCSFMHLGETMRGGGLLSTINSLLSALSAQSTEYSRAN